MPHNFEKYLDNLLQLEAVACKDWLTNKVDRSVTGKIARQQCAGEIQLPLNDLGAVALDFRGRERVRHISSGMLLLPVSSTLQRDRCYPLPRHSPISSGHL